MMKCYLIVILLLAFVSSSLGQTPYPLPTPSVSPEKTRNKDFGSSLKKYEEKKPKNSRDQQKNKEPDDDEIIRIGTDLVLNDVLVSDQKGNVITGLGKDDFVVIDNGVPQTLEVFSRGENSTVPRSIVLLIDHLPLEISYLKMSVTAAKTLVDKLGSQDEMAIVTTDTILRQDFTADKAILKHTLDDVERKGLEFARWYMRGAKLDDKNYEDVLQYPKSRQLNQFHALMAVLNEMFDEKGRQRIVIFQGDGIHVIWLKTDRDAPYPVSYATRMNSGMKYLGEAKSMSNFGFGEVKESIENSGATIYSVGTGIRFFGLPEKERMARARISFENWCDAMGIDRREYTPDINRMFIDREEKIHTAGQAAMYKVAELSGGNTAMIEKPEDAERVYSTILATIKSRYIIGYYPADKKPGERRRNVKVEVRGHPEYIIDGRKTYILQ